MDSEPNTKTQVENSEVDKVQKEKPIPQKEGKVIVRNIQFDLKEPHLKKEFQKFGTIVAVNVPIKNENNLNRGFGFIEFSTKEEAQKAIDGMNGQKYKGRVLAVEYSTPSRKYESKVTNIMEHTKMTRQDIVQPLIVRQDRDEKKKVKEEADKVNEKTIKKFVKEKKKQETERAQKQEEYKKNRKIQQEQGKTLFVRNIGYDTTEQQFKEFMGNFGELQYAVLCKVKELRLNNSDGSSQQQTHKGTGFVQYKDNNVAEQLVELSSSIELKLDEECKTSRLNARKNNGKKDDNKGVLSVISGELELNGRRLVIKEAMSRNEAVEKQQEDQDKKKMKEDKRNLNYKKEGLLNEDSWIHKVPRVTEKDIEQRQRLLKEKEAALSKNTNLFVSKIRIQIRNLPRRDFFEKELKELMMVVIDEWLKTVDDKKLKEQKKKKFLKQVKILRDQQKTDTSSGDKLASGLGFAEFDDEDLALFALRYLNNMQLVTNKGIVADFSLEDQRALHKRDMKQEKQKKIQQEKKREEKAEKRLQDAKTFQMPASGVVELGKKAQQQQQEDAVLNKNKKKKPEGPPIDQITDLELLNKMMRMSNSRGKKQRIKKRIDKLEGKEPEVVVEKSSGTENKPKLKQVEEPKISAQEKVQSLLKRREQKIQNKADQLRNRNKFALKEEEREIMKTIKNRKTEKKRERARETDEFDDILNSYKNKVLKKMKKNMEGATEKSIKEGDFIEVEMSD